MMDSFVDALFGKNEKKDKKPKRKIIKRKVKKKVNKTTEPMRGFERYMRLQAGSRSRRGSG